MATAEEYGAWIVSNKDKKGTPEFETVAEAYRLSRASKPTPTFTPGPEGFKQSMKEAIAADPSPMGAGLVAGAGTALDNAALRLKQLVTGLNPQDEAKARANRTLLQASTPAQVGNVVGQVAALAPMAGAGIMSNAVAGAGFGAMGEPVLDNESAVDRAGVGALLGAGGAGVAKLVTGSPILQTPQSKALIEQGIVPTLGQTASSGKGVIPRILSRAEEGMTSVPGVGDIVGLARQRAVQDFNRAAINKTVPQGSRVTEVGPEAINQAKSILGASYDDVYRGVKVRPDQMLKQELNAAAQSTTLPLNKVQQKTFDNAVDRNLWQRLPKGTDVEAGVVKMEIESQLGKASREAYASGDRALGEALTNARDAVRNWLARNVGPGASRLDELNQNRANLESVRKAAERAKGRDGVFTPFQLQSTSKTGSEMRDLANTAQSVLASRVPDSGTPLRAMVGMGVLGAGAGVNEYMGGPGYLSALALAPLLYSRPGAAWLQGGATPQALQSAAPVLSQTLRGILSQQ